MQQTEKYKLGLIDLNDPFLPYTLNENTRAVERVLSGEEAARISADAALTAKTAALTKALGSGGKTARIAYGTYTGTGTYGKSKPSELTFDFCPVYVIIVTADALLDRYSCIMMRDAPTGRPTVSSNSGLTVSWTDNSVQFWSSHSAAYQNNEKGTVHYYFVVGYDPNS